MGRQSYSAQGPDSGKLGMAGRVEPFPGVWIYAVQFFHQRWYLAFNPSLGLSFQGENAGQGLEFNPSLKVTYDIIPRIAGGIEYYASLGPLSGFDPYNQQQHMIFPVVDLDLGPEWEFNFGVGFGLTESTDHLIVKLILGRRF